MYAFYIYNIFLNASNNNCLSYPIHIFDHTYIGVFTAYIKKYIVRYSVFIVFMLCCKTFLLLLRDTGKNRGRFHVMDRFNDGLRSHF